MTVKGGGSLKDGWYTIDAATRQVTVPLADTTELLKLEEETLVLFTVTATFTDDLTEEVVMKEEISFAISIIVPEKPEEKEEEKTEETKVETSDFVFVPPVQKEKPVELKKWIPDPIRATVSLVTETGNIKIAFSREVYIAIDEDGKLVAQSANRVL